MLRGFAISVLAAVGAGFVLGVIQRSSFVEDPLGIVAFLIYAIPSATVTGLVVGIPSHLILARLRIVSLVPYLLAGVVAAFAYGLFWEVARVSGGRSGLDHVYWPQVRAWAYGTSPSSLAGAATFWLVVVKKPSWRKHSTARRAASP